MTMTRKMTRAEKRQQEEQNRAAREAEFQTNLPMLALEFLARANDLRARGELLDNPDDAIAEIRKKNGVFVLTLGDGLNSYYRYEFGQPEWEFEMLQSSLHDLEALADARAEERQKIRDAQSAAIQALSSEQRQLLGLKF